MIIEITGTMSIIL